MLPKALPAIEINPVFVPNINKPNKLWYNITVIPRPAKTTGLEFLARCIASVKTYDYAIIPKIQDAVLIKILVRA